MSKLFFDHLIVLDEVELEIKKTGVSKEEQEELWGIVDEIVHHKVFDAILSRLPREHHEEFLGMFHAAPHDEKFIFEYLKVKIGDNIEDLLKQELGGLAFDLLKDLRSNPKNAPRKK